MNISSLKQIFRRMSAQLSRIMRICRIRAGRCGLRMQRAVGRWRAAPESRSTQTGSGPNERTGRRFALQRRVIRIGTQRLGLRVRHGAGESPGWSLAAATGGAAVLLMMILQVSVMFSRPGAPSETATSEEPTAKYRVEPGTPVALGAADERGDFPAGANADPGEETEEPAGRGVNRNAHLLDIDVALVAHREFAVAPESFLVTSVREAISASGYPQRTADGAWQPYRIARHETAIQPLRHEAPFSEPSSAPLPPVEHGFAMPVAADGEEAAGRSGRDASYAVTAVDRVNLFLEITLEETVSVGEPDRLYFRVINVGSVTAENVVLGVEIPDALTYHKGRSLEYRIGTIPPGETRLARLTPIAAAAGTARYDFDLTAEPGFDHRQTRRVRIVDSIE